MKTLPAFLSLAGVSEYRCAEEEQEAPPSVHAAPCPEELGRTLLQSSPLKAMIVMRFSVVAERNNAQTAQDGI